MGRVILNLCGGRRYYLEGTNTKTTKLFHGQAVCSLGKHAHLLKGPYEDLGLL